MIELPADVVPSSVEVTPLDYGFLQRPSSGAETGRVDRPGSRWRAAFEFPPMTADRARRVVGRLAAARREGLRLPWPLLGIDQGAPGAPVIDGGGQAGIRIAVRGLRAHYVAREGYWLHVEQAAAGGRCLHTVRTDLRAGGDGRAVLTIEPPLRMPLVDGDRVELARPTFEGWLIEAPGYSVDVARLVRGATLLLEEAR